MLKPLSHSVKTALPTLFLLSLSVGVTAQVPVSRVVQAPVQSEIVLLNAPLFNKENVSPDSPPEQIEALNNPTEQNAKRAALARIFRNYRAFQVAAMVEKARLELITSAIHKYGLEPEQTFEIMEAILRDNRLIE